jgi:hypothetical protein
MIVVHPPKFFDRERLRPRGGVAGFAALLPALHGFFQSLAEVHR